MTKPIALAGIGKIARDAHLPALDASPDWHLGATISRNSGVDGVPGFEDMDAFLKDPKGIETVSLALPPAPRYAYALQAMRAGLNVMLEKPPAVTLAECRTLIDESRKAGVTLYMSWHSRAGAACAEAARRLKDARLKRLHIDWREDVRQTHPGQDWVWEAGNLGVFDPGINAFAILGRIIDQPIHLTKAHMIFPEGRDTPITAELTFAHPEAEQFDCQLDWNYEGDPVWDMEIETDQGTFTLTRSGTGIDDGAGEIDLHGSTEEYELLYAELARLVAAGESETDTRPLEHAADAFLLGTRETGAPFSW